MNWKKIGHKLLFPPIWLMVLLTVGSAAGLTLVFLRGLSESPIAYVVYMLAFYTLSVICIFCFFTFPQYYRNAKEKVYANPFTRRLATDPIYRTHASLYASLAINLLYVAIKVVSSIIYNTSWFMIFAAYYAIMAIMRFLLVRYVNQNGIGKNLLAEWRRSRLCAIFLMTVNLALSGAVLMMVYFDRGFRYGGILIYVMAMYAFYTTTLAIVNIVKYSKYRSPILSTAKIVNLASALITMLALETAMLAQFGTDSSPEFHRTMIIATGAGISVIVVTMSVYMIVRSTREIRAMRKHSQSSVKEP